MLDRNPIDGCKVGKNEDSFHSLLPIFLGRTPPSASDLITHAAAWRLWLYDNDNECHDQKSKMVGTVFSQDVKANRMEDLDDEEQFPKPASDHYMSYNHTEMLMGNLQVF
jgi:hypothetical protein